MQLVRLAEEYHSAQGSLSAKILLADRLDATQPEIGLHITDTDTKTVIISLDKLPAVKLTNLRDLIAHVDSMARSMFENDADFSIIKTNRTKPVTPTPTGTVLEVPAVSTDECRSET